MAGFFPSVPSQVNFDLSFAPVNGQWHCSASRFRSGRAGRLHRRRPSRRSRKNSPRQTAPSRLMNPGSRRWQNPHPRPGSRRQTTSQPTASNRNRRTRQPCERPKMLPDEALKSMKVMFATPCYISAVSMHYVTSIFELTHHCNRFGLQCILHMHSESLITRSRNKMVLKFLSDETLTHLFWIDSDITFTPQSVCRLLLDRPRRHRRRLSDEEFQLARQRPAGGHHPAAVRGSLHRISIQSDRPWR